MNSLLSRIKLFFSKDKANLYFECHITIEPVFDKDRDFVQAICSKWGFKLAELLMQKRKEDTANVSKYDTFCTSHSLSRNDITNRMLKCINELNAFGFKVWRYKVEDTIFDSRKADIYGLIDDTSPYKNNFKY